MKAGYDGRRKGSPRTQTLVTHRTASRRPTAGPNGASATTFGPAAPAVVSTQRHVQIDGSGCPRTGAKCPRTRGHIDMGHRPEVPIEGSTHRDRSADLAHPANTRNAPEREHRSSAPERRAVAPWAEHRTAPLRRSGAVGHPPRS